MSWATAATASAISGEVCITRAQVAGACRSIRDTRSRRAIRFRSMLSYTLASRERISVARSLAIACSPLPKPRCLRRQAAS